GTKPWRVPRVEAALAGASLDPATLRMAAILAAEGARGHGHNDFKIELMQRAIVRAVETAGARAWPPRSLDNLSAALMAARRSRAPPPTPPSSTSPARLT